MSGLCRLPLAFSRSPFGALALSACLSGQGMSGFGQTATPPDTRLYVDYSAKPSLEALASNDFCILDPAAQVAEQLLKTPNKTFLAYLPLVEVAKGSPAETAAIKRGIPMVSRNGAWDSSLLDVTHPAWPDYIVEDLALPALAKGYGGLFLDTADSLELIKDGPAHLTKRRQALIQTIRRLHQELPGKKLVLNRGFPLFDEVADCLSGVLIEGLFQTWDPATGVYTAVPHEGTEWLTNHIGRIQKHRLPVFIVDYVDPRDTPKITETLRRIKETGCIPFVSTPDLQGLKRPEEATAPLKKS